MARFPSFFTYLLSFLFEGRVLYSLLERAGADATLYILATMIAHFFGQFTCGFFCKSHKAARKIALLSMGICSAAAIVFFFSIPTLWLFALIICGYASGAAVASWGYYLRAFTPKKKRLKSCADMLIYSNIIMIAINTVAVNLSLTAGLILS